MSGKCPEAIFDPFGHVGFGGYFALLGHCAPRFREMAILLRIPQILIAFLTQFLIDLNVGVVCLGNENFMFLRIVQFSTLYQMEVLR